MGGRGYQPKAQREAAAKELEERKQNSAQISEPVKEEKKEKKKSKTLSEYMKEAKNQDLDFFLGEGNWERTSNKYMTFKRVINDDTSIIQTNNLKVIKESPVLIINNNQAVYLKDWQIRKSSSWEHGIDGYAVKLNRKFFKPYTFRSDFRGYHFEKADTFDSLKKVAKEQEKLNIPMKIKRMSLEDNLELGRKR